MRLAPLVLFLIVLATALNSRNTNMNKCTLNFHHVVRIIRKMVACRFEQLRDLIEHCCHVLMPARACNR